MPRRNNGTTGVSLDLGAAPIDPAAAAAAGAGSDSTSGAGPIRDSAGTEFNGSIHSHPDTRNSDGTFRRKRGRKAGSQKTRVYSDIEKSAEMLTKGLLVFHATLAAMTKTPELMLDETEAKGLSESGLTLLSLYDVRPDPKVEAAIMFAGQIGLVYGSRIVTIRHRKAQEKKEKSAGVAGVYAADGTAMGTTDFTVQQEYPIPRAEMPN